MFKNLQKYPSKIIDTFDLSKYLPTDFVSFNMVMPGDVITTEQGFMQ